MKRHVRTTSAPLTVLAALATLGVTGCYNPDLSGTGGFRCNTSNACPDGYVCQGPTGSRVCVKDGTTLPDSGSPDQAARDTGGEQDSVDASPATLTCSLDNQPQHVAAGVFGSSFGLAFNEGTAPQQPTLYISYLAGTTSSPAVHVGSAVLTQPWTDVKSINLSGTSDHTAIVAYGANKWAVVFQDKQGTQQHLKLMRDTDTTIKTLTSGIRAGIYPDVAVLEPSEVLVAVHGYASIENTTTGQLVVDNGADTATYLIRDSTHGETGLDNRVIVDRNKPIYGTVGSKVLGNGAGAIVATISTLAPLQASETSVELGDFAATERSMLGLDLAPGGYRVASYKDGANLVARYNAPSANGANVPGLDGMARPRVALRDEMLAVVATNDSATKVAVLDLKTGSWTTTLRVASGGRYATVVATPGASAGDVVFHVAYLDSLTLAVQPVVCSRSN